MHEVCVVDTHRGAHLMAHPSEPHKHPHPLPTHSSHVPWVYTHVNGLDRWIDPTPIHIDWTYGLCMIEFG